MREGFGAAVGTDLLGLFFEPLPEASLAEMLTAAIREMRLVQYLDADHTLVVIREILHEFILSHFEDSFEISHDQGPQFDCHVEEPRSSLLFLAPPTIITSQRHLICACA